MNRLLLLLVLFLSPCLRADDDDLYTNIYVVPPTFLTIGETTKGWKPEPDPFRNLRPTSPQRTAKEILHSVGIHFGTGASAIYNSATSQLIVRNTEDQMKLVEAYIDSIRTGVEKQLYLSVREFKISGTLADIDTTEFQAPFTDLLSDLSQSIAKQRNRKKDSPPQVKRFNSFEAFREALGTDPADLVEEEDATIRFTAKPYSDPKFQVIARLLGKMKAVTTYQAPSLMSRSGEPCITETNGRRYGISAVLGANEFTVDVHAFIPEPDKALQFSRGTFETPFKQTVFDGENALFVSRSDEKNETRLIFVKAQIIDPAGIPIHKEGGRAAAEKEAEKPEAKTGQENPDISPSQVQAVKQADKLAETGSYYSAQGRYKESAVYFREAVEMLPEIPITAERRKAYNKQLSNMIEKMKQEPKKVSLLEEKLNAVVIPTVDFQEKPALECFAEILKFLLEQKKEGLFPDTNAKLLLDDPDFYGDL